MHLIQYKQKGKRINKIKHKNNTQNFNLNNSKSAFKIKNRSNNKKYKNLVNVKNLKLWSSRFTNSNSMLLNKCAIVIAERGDLLSSTNVEYDIKHISLCQLIVDNIFWGIDYIVNKPLKSVNLIITKLITSHKNIKLKIYKGVFLLDKEKNNYNQKNLLHISNNEK